MTGDRTEAVEGETIDGAMVDGSTDDGGADGGSPRPDATSTEPGRWSHESLAAWVYGVAAVVAFPLLLNLGGFYWFFRDDWEFITGRELDVDGLSQDHNGHWVTLPVLVFRLFFAVFGLHSYVPYQAAVILAHLVAITLVRVVMRRAGVDPWIATALAVMMLVFGPGREDILWAFQVGYTGAVALGLAHLLLADHDGPPGRRDLLGLACGALAITSTSVGVVMVGVVGLTLVLRQRWVPALWHTIPLAAVYGIWYLVVEPTTSRPFGSPPLSVTFDWVRSGIGGTAEALAQGEVGAWVLGVVLVVGTALALLPDPRGMSVRRFGAAVATRVQRRAAPLAMMAAAAAFFGLAAQGRWFAGPAAARASRFVYVGAVFMVPLIGVAAHELTRRWRPAVALAVVACIATIPPNIRVFDDPPFGPDYHRRYREILTTVIRLPQAKDANPELRPLPDPFLGPDLDMEFLLWAHHAGKLPASTGPIDGPLRRELQTLLALRQEPVERLPAVCHPIDADGPVDVEPGDAIWISDTVRIHLVVDDNRWNAGAEFSPAWGRQLTVERDDVQLDITPGRGSQAEAVGACLEPAP